ncbi:MULTISPECIES: hypothetical protein [Streptomyces]|uniref:Uncharacterized protein n=2 Tax=Streptomyces TaxID=1883 RepID=A0ABU4KHW1_9ACTN|nr:hypothetical protein [Streptomyces roseolus]MDX2296875.1 hypothetical protein [Streptomyces roseolus]
MSTRGRGTRHAAACEGDDALLLSTAAAGGEAVVLPGDGADGAPTGGVGALLRWPRSGEEKAAARR